MSLTLDIDGKSPGIFCKIFSPVCDAKEVPHPNFFFFFFWKQYSLYKALEAATAPAAPIEERPARWEKERNPRGLR